jgi:hypothetical protein
MFLRIRAVWEGVDFFIWRESRCYVKVPTRRQKGCGAHLGHTLFFEREGNIELEDLDALAFSMIPKCYPS